MKTYFSIIAVLLLITINSFSQVTFKKTVSTEVKTPAVNVGGIKQTLIQKQSPVNKNLLIPKDTTNAQMGNAVVDIAFNSAYGKDYSEVLGRYNLQIFLLNEKGIEIARWNYNRNKPNVTQDLNAANDGYSHIQLPMEIENSKAASAFGSFKNGATLKFVFDCSFQNIEGGGENYFYINTFSASLNFLNPSFKTNMWLDNDSDQKYTAGHKSSVFSFYREGLGFSVR